MVWVVPPLRFSLWVPFQVISVTFRFFSNSTLDLLKGFFGQDLTSFNWTLALICGYFRDPLRLCVSRLVAQQKLSCHVLLDDRDCDQVKLIRPKFFKKLFSVKPFWPEGSTRHNLKVDNWRFQVIQLKGGRLFLLLLCSLVA